MAGKIKVEDAQPLTPHTNAIVEAGKRLLIESVETGREFCKSMISITLAAIPTYIGLLKLFILKDHLLSVIAGSFWFVPVVLFVFSATSFVAGYLPTKSIVSIELPDEIEVAMKRAINRRYWFGVSGFVLMCIGIGTGVGVIATL
ncbi:hypothetical protein [Desulfobacter sp. UBA2225]|uniref:hypothetical protein n=1 Tax=Desulfobacter sp. UBA2225 TaxID=1961413 RepID=UPI00257DF53C|nr:hypothetical protein [Desulfobacter sp. UBA2225]